MAALALLVRARAGEFSNRPGGRLANRRSRASRPACCRRSCSTTADIPRCRMRLHLQFQASEAARPAFSSAYFSTDPATTDSKRRACIAVQRSLPARGSTTLTASLTQPIFDGFGWIASLKARQGVQLQTCRPTRRPSSLLPMVETALNRAAMNSPAGEAANAWLPLAQGVRWSPRPSCAAATVQLITFCRPQTLFTAENTLVAGQTLSVAPSSLFHALGRRLDTPPGDSVAFHNQPRALQHEGEICATMP